MSYNSRVLSEIAADIKEWGEKHGWNDERSFGDHIALMHSELSEALEEYRNNHEISEMYFHLDDDGHAKPEGIPIELADVIIRILHLCARHNIDIDFALTTKLEYNERRTYRHGGKRL